MSRRRENPRVSGHFDVSCELTARYAPVRVGLGWSISREASGREP
jgi:hypothetical protein